MQILNQISENLQNGKAKIVKELVQEALDAGVKPAEILSEGLLCGMNVIGEKFKNNEVYVPEVLVAARAMNMGTQVLKPYLAESGVELVIRTPVVPGFNDTAEEIKAIAKFAASLPGVREHHLLPYHRLGQDKYAGLGRNYALKEIEPPTKEKMEYLLSVAEESGLKCQIGG